MTDRRRRHGRGQALAIVAVLLPGLLAAMALGIDGAYLFVQHRLAQSAADLAALAGARSLPGDPAGARTRAASVAGANGYTSGVTVTTPFGGNAGRVLIEIYADARPFFLPALGVQTVDVAARAVAQSTSPATPTYSVFAGEVNCSGDGDKFIDWSGSDIDVVGAVHSNGGIRVSGSNNSVTGATSYQCLNKFKNSGSGNSFNPAATKTGVAAWPVTYAASDFPCTYTRSGTFDLSDNGAWWVGGTKASGLLRPGVYCATGGAGIIKLSQSNVTGTVTFVAGFQVELSGSNFNFTAYLNNVLLFAQGNTDGALKLSGSGGTWRGILYAPIGWAELSGSNLSVVGALVAERVKINGSRVTIDATALQPPTDQTLQLVE